MCQGSDPYQYGSPMTVGGPTGNYVLRAPAPQGMLVEWAVYGVANGSGGASTALVSADLAENATPTLPLDGSVTFKNATQAIPACVFALAANASIYPAVSFFPLKSPDLQIVINAAASTSMYVTVAFRWRAMPLMTFPDITAEPEVDDWQEARVNARRSQEIERQMVEQMTKVGGRNGR